MALSSPGLEVARLRQSLVDLSLSEAAEVVLLRCDVAHYEAQLIGRLQRAAHGLSFVTAVLSLRELPLEALDDVVRSLCDNLVAPTRSGQGAARTGLMRLLDRFARDHGEEAGALFAERVAEVGAQGDLAVLAEAYLRAGVEPRAEARLLRAWLSGTQLRRRAGVTTVHEALSDKTARKVLGELTRVVRALGYAGCAFFLTEGDSIVHRTVRQRERSYTVLRELIDNFDAGQGMLATRLSVTGRESLFSGERSMECLPPLAGRMRVPSGAVPIPPHRSTVAVDIEDTSRPLVTPEPPRPHQARALRALIRVAQGLPPVEAVAALSVGYDRIDRAIVQLLEHAEAAGSVFSVLEGEYGTGKTHLLLHLADRALERGHPVFRLNLERLNFDLGSPQRHLHRLLAESELPLRRRPSALARLAVWVRSKPRLRALRRELEAIEAKQGEASGAAKRALRALRSAHDGERALVAFLSGRDLLMKSSAATYRQDAYARLLLWLELLERLEGCRGPVLLIDEAENLYTGGASRAVRRTSLRSLSFYCGGALPSACVVLATTPHAFVAMKKESRELLAEVSEQRSQLDCEDAEMLRRRLWGLKSQPVPEFGRVHRARLCTRILETHRHVRGMRVDIDLRRILRETREQPPRVLVRRMADELESAWWAHRLASR